MFLPLTSDAELRHWPIMTVVMILVTIIAFIIQHQIPDTSGIARVRDVFPPDERGNFVVRDQRGMPTELDPDMVFGRRRVPGYMPLALSHGEGIHPLQWVTNMFLHAGPGHLLGNMAFLWVFGLVVEGIVGPVRFTALYLGCGIAQSAIGQILFLGIPESPSLGASGAIYSLLVLAALWAPGDNIQTLIVVFVTFFFVDVPILILAACYLLLDFGALMFSGFELSSAWLHVMGGLVGFAVGAAALKFDWVDCGRQDMLSRIREIRGKPPSEKKPKTLASKNVAENELHQQELQQRIAIVEKSLDVHLNAGRHADAIATMMELRKHAPGTQWNEPRLVKLIQLLKKERMWDETLHFMQDYLVRFPGDKANLLRLSMSRILLLEKGRPKKALALLKAVDFSMLNEAQSRTLAELRKLAEERLESDDVDFQEQ